MLLGKVTFFLILLVSNMLNKHLHIHANGYTCCTLLKCICLAEHQHIHTFTHTHTHSERMLFPTHMNMCIDLDSWTVGPAVYSTKFVGCKLA